ncbi:MAG: hypothetical protein LBC19_14225 [Tannerella sp.]|nr:hypothetical protein [Tannerella sp.]
MKKVILGVIFMAAMSLAVNVNAKDGKTKKESPKTEQCCKTEAKATAEKKEAKECCKKEAEKKCCQQAKDGEKKACSAESVKAAADKK